MQQKIYNKAAKQSTGLFGVQLHPREIAGAISAAEAVVIDAESAGRLALAKCRRARVAVLKDCHRLALTVQHREAADFQIPASQHAKYLAEVADDTRGQSDLFAQQKLAVRAQLFGASRSAA